MLRGFFPGDRLRQLGARFRLQHSVWLSRAIGESRRYPRIPTKPEELGGWSRMRSSEERRARADLWWSIALDRVDDP